MSLSLTQAIDPAKDDDWLQRVEAASEAIEFGVQPQLIAAGSSGAYVVFDKAGVSASLLEQNKRRFC